MIPLWLQIWKKRHASGGKKDRALPKRPRSFTPRVELLEDRLAPAVSVWDGGAGDGDWTSAANWVNDVAPTAGDDLVFSGNVNVVTNNDFAPDTTFNTIQITAPGFTLGGNALRLNGGLTASNTSGSNTVSLDITLLNAQLIVAANAGTTLTLSGTVDTAGLTGTTFLLGTSALTFDGSGTTEVTGTITGDGSITKSGGGTVILAGANDYEGITDVRQGVLQVTNNSGLGSAVTGHTEVQAGAALQISGGITVAEALAIREGGVGFGNGTDPSSLGALRSVGGSNTWTGGIQLAGADNVVGVDAGSTLDISGQVSAATSSAIDLVKVGGGALRLSGSEDNVYTGTTTVLQGSLELNKDAGKDAIGGDLVIGDNIGGDDAAVVRILKDEQIPYLNYFDVALTSVTLGSSGRLELLDGTIDETIGNLVLTTGSTYSADIDLNGGKLTLGGASITLNAFQGSSGDSPAATIQDGTLDLGTFFSGAAGGTTKTFAVNDTQLANVATDLNISAAIDGTADVSITKTGAGTLQLGGTNTFVGPFIMNGGIVEVANDAAFGTGLVSLQNSGNVLRAVGDRTVANDIGLDGNVSFFGSDDLTFSGTATLSGGRTLLVMDSAQTVTFSGGIGEGIFGSQNLAKSGRGTLALTGTNTYSGSTTVNNDGGTLELSGGGTLLNSSGVTVGIGGTLHIDNSGTSLADRINDLTAIALNGKLIFTGNATADASEYVGTISPGGSLASTIEVRNTSAGAFSSVLTANALAVSTDRTVSFVGTGVALSADGPSRFSVTNNPGGLDDGILPMGVVLGPGGSVDFATYGSSPEGFAIIPLPAAAYVTDLSQASASSNVRLSADTVLTTSKAVNAILIDPGVNITGAGATLTVNAGRTIFVGDGASIEVDNLNVGTGMITVVEGTATISSSIFAGSIQKGGSGTLVLSGDNQYTGATNVNEGVLRIQHSHALGSPAAATAIRPNAALELDGSGGDLTIVGEALTNLDGTGGPGDAGALRNIAGNNTWAGNITVAGGSANLTDALGGFPVITNGVAVIDVAAGTSLNVTGTVAGSADLVKDGEGQLEYSGVLANTHTGSTRILDGTLLLNKEPGVNALAGPAFVGDGAGGNDDDVLRLAGSNQITDAQSVTVNASGRLDLDGNSETFANLTLTVGASRSSVNIGAGGTLTTNGNITVVTEGTGNPAGAEITGGTLALQLPGTSGAPTARTWQVNDGASGADLTVTSSIVDGTGLQSMGITKTGFGELVLGGSSGNSFTGTTTVNEGTLTLSKTGGNAISGPLVIGDNNPQSGFAGSDVVRLTQPDQLPDFLAPITIATTGLLDLNGNDETIGNVEAQNALTLQAGSSVATGAGTLTINGNILASAANGATLFTLFTAPTISGRLNTGTAPVTIDTGADRSELPFELHISADVSGAGLVKAGTGTLLLSGDNDYTGSTFVNVGSLAVGSDTALGASTVYLPVATTLLAYDGERTLANTFFAAGVVVSLVAGNNVGGGGNDITFTGGFNLTGGTTTINTAAAGTADFAGGIGETFGSAALSKSGFGTMAISGVSTYSGTSTVNASGGTLVLRDQGTILNTSGITVANNGGSFVIDNTNVNVANRVGDTTGITLVGGTLAFVGKAGEASSETVGTVTLNNNTSSQIQSIVSPTAGSSASWRIGTITRTANQGSTLVLAGRGVDLGSATANQIVITTAGAVGTAAGLDDGIIPYAVISGSTGLEFASHTNVAGNNVITPLTTFLTSLAPAIATDNVKLSADEALAAAKTVNALLVVGPGVDVTGAFGLTLNSGLLVVSGTGNTIQTSTLTLGGTEGLIYATSGSDVDISSTVAGASSALGKGGHGMVTMSGPTASTFTGTTIVTQGTYRAAKDTAFGSTAGGVTVFAGATVELTGGITVAAETLPLTLSGSGEGVTGYRPLVSLSGTNTWLGNISLATNRTGIEVAGGSELIVGGATGTGVVGANGFNKFGAGTLELAGISPNTLTQPSIIWQGTVELNKSNGSALTAATSPSIFVGDHVGGDNADRLVQLASSQIVNNSTTANAQIVQVTASGLYDLNGQTEDFGAAGMAVANHALNLFVGPLYSADVDLNGGTLTFTGGTAAANTSNILVSVLAGGSPVAARIDDGTLVLTNGTGPAVADINVTDSAAIEDLVITASIAGTGGLDKVGTGRLVLDPTLGSTYSGTTTIAGGELVARGTNPLGDTAGNTVVGSGFSLLIDSSSSAEDLTVNGNGFGGQGAVRGIGGASNWSGDVSLVGASQVGVDAGSTLTLSGAISGASLTKILPGTLVLGGGAGDNLANTQSTVVNEGVVLLDKADGTAATVNLTVGSNTLTGGTDADVARLARDNQITGAVTVNASGLLDLDGFSDAITTLTLQTGPTFSGHVDLDGGTLTLGGNLSQTSAGGLFPTSSPAALIEDGTLDTGGVQRTITTADAGLNIRELQIDATLDDGGAGIILTGSGLTVLGADNTASLTGTVSLSIANVVVATDGGLGSGTVNVGGSSTLFAVDYDGVASPVTIANDITLNSNLTLRGDEDLTLSGTISGQGAANRVLAINVNNEAVASLTGTINLGNDATGRTLNVDVNTFNDVAFLDALVQNGAGGTHSLAKAGTGTLVVSNAGNTYAGTTTISAGALRITSNTALGGAGATLVGSGATLQVVGGLTVAEALSLSGTGQGNSGALRLIDSSGASETTAWTGGITLTANAFVRVDDGDGTPDTLDLGGGTAADVAGNFTLTKNGPGILQTSGTGVNSLNTIEVREGTVELNKTGAGTSFDTSLIVGDGGGGASADVVRLFGNDQIPTVTVTVGASGLLDLNDFSDTIGALILQRLNPAANVATGSGTLTLGSTLTVQNAGVTTGATAAATISGSLSVGGATRNFDVNDSYVLDAAEDLVVSAAISSTGAFGITKQLYGTMALTGDNTYTGTTTVNAQTLDFLSAGFNNGTNALVGGTLVVRDGGDIAQASSISVTSGASLVLDNTNGVVDRIGNGAAVAIAGGAFTLIGSGSAAVTEDIGALTINAGANTGTDTTITITDAGQVTQLQANTLARGAGAMVHFVGTNTDIQNDSNARILIDTVPAATVYDATAGILPWATISGPAGFDLVTDGDAGASFFIERFTGYDTDVNALTHGVVRLSGGASVLAGATSFRGLLLKDGASLDLAGNVLTVGAGSSPALIVSATDTNPNTNLITNSVPATGAIAPGTRESLYAVEAGSTLDVSAALNGSGAFSKLRTGTLSLAADSDNGAGQTFTGTVTVNAGTLVVTNGDALGNEAGTASEVTVSRRAVLVLDATGGDLNLGNTAITVGGYGLNDDVDGDSTTLGALRVVGGTNVTPRTVTVGTGTTAVSWNTATTVVDVADDTTLNLLATIGTGANALNKVGAGTMIYGGTAQNSNTGTIAVNEGTLILNKTAGTGPTAVRSTLTINDLAGNLDPVGSATVQYASTAAPDQILNTAAVTVNGNGTLDFNGATDNIGLLTVAGGAVQNSAGGGTLTTTGLTMNGGTVDSGTGTVTVAGTINYTSGLGTTPATISGSLDLGGAVRAFVVNDGVGVTDLTVDAVVANGGITKTGTGGLSLSSSANTFAGNLTLNGGLLLVSGDASGTVAGTDTTLGVGSLILQSGTVVADGADRTIARPIQLIGSVTLGSRRDFAGTNDLTFTATAAATLTADVTLTVEDPLTVVSITGDIGQDASNRGLTKTGLGTLILGGTNTYQGTTAVAAGALQITSSSALGGTTGGTSVANGAQLQLANDITVVGEALTLVGTTNNATFVPNSGFGGTGHLRNVSGTNTWQGTVSITGGNAGQPTAVTVGVDAGELIINGLVNQVNTNGGGLYKIGSGTLELAGSTANTYSGTTTVLEGVLELNKSSGVAVAGPLQVGDNVGGDSSAQVVYVSGAGADQIGNVAVSIGTDGLLDLNGFAAATETVGAVTIALGDTSSGDIDTGAAGTSLDFTALTVTARPGLSSVVTSTIAGELRFAATRALTVNDSPSEVELEISAVISQSAAAGLTKVGAGRLVLSGDNTYGGTTTVSAGALRVEHEDALGDTGAATGTTVSAGGVLEVSLAGTGTIDNENLTVSGSGIINGSHTAIFTTPLGTGALRNLQGATTWAGSVTVAATNTAIDVAAGSALDLSGAVAFGSNLTTVKTGSGTLTLSGAASNTFAGTRGTLSVNEGTLELNKSGAAVAVPVNLIIGDNAGGDNADVVVHSTTAGTNQIDNGSAVTVLSTGLLDTNGINDTIGTLTLGVGPTSGDVQTGAGTLTLGGNVLAIVQAGTVAATIDGSLSLGAADRTFTVHDSTAGEELIVNAVISGSAGIDIIKAGRGALTLAGNNTYTGTTTVNVDGGTLLANTPATVSASNYIVNAGGTLGGNGQINGTVALQAAGSNLIVGGILNPGTPGDAGVLTVNNNVTFNAGAQLFVDIDGPTPADHDQLRVTGTGSVVINATAQLAGSVTYAATPADSFKVIDKVSAGGISGTFGNATGVSPPANTVVGGKLFNFTYTGDTGNDFVLAPVGITGPVVYDAGQAGTSDDTQRSMITRIQFTINSDVTFDPGAFTVTRVGPGGGQVNVAVAAAPDGFGNTVITLTFTGGDGFTYARAGGFALDDGNYKLEIDATKIHSTSGDGALTSNVTDEFFRFYGDADGDRDVDSYDFLKYRNASLQPGTYASLIPFLDYDGDGDVGGVGDLDYTQFQLRRGKILSP